MTNVKINLYLVIKALKQAGALEWVHLKVHCYIHSVVNKQVLFVQN